MNLIMTLKESIRENGKMGKKIRRLETDDNTWICVIERVS